MFYLKNYFVIFNDNTSKDLGIAVIKRPSIPSPKRRYIEKEVQGRNGMLYEDLGTYEDIEINVEFNFISWNPNKWNSNFRIIKKWINNIKDNKLKFSDDLGFFYLVNKTEITGSEREFKRLGKFEVVFTCEPFMYLNEGQEKMTLPNVLDNDFEECQPIYYISGEGLLNLTVNGITVKANIGQNLIINTKLGLCYRVDGNINNIALTGDYKDLYIKEGSNTFDYTQGFNIEIIPNWRCL